MNTDIKINKNHSITWNPSIRGFKSEDTIIVEENYNKIITEDYRWPMLNVETEFGNVLRPDIFIK